MQSRCGICIDNENRGHVAFKTPGRSSGLKAFVQAQSGKCLVRASGCFDAPVSAAQVIEQRPVIISSALAQQHAVGVSILLGHDINRRPGSVNDSDVPASFIRIPHVILHLVCCPASTVPYAVEYPANGCFRCEDRKDDVDCT